MKINKKSPKHWLALVKFGATVLTALFLRVFLKNSSRPLVLLYGHKLNGNLKALYDYTQYNNPENIKIQYATMDSSYCEELIKSNINALDLTKLSSAIPVAKCMCIISDHGLHCLILALILSDIKFIDVWHGIPFKGFTSKDFTTLHKYDRIFVSSELIKNLYINKFGFNEHHVVTTGYGKTDLLLNDHDTTSNTELEFIKNKRLVLFAPTWKQDSNDRNIIPFGITETEFCEKLNFICKKHEAIFAIRSHLNTNMNFSSNTKLLPSNTYPNTEQILKHTDILISDWSSIAFDYLPLSRPTLFLDISPPFKNGFSLGPEYRFGDIISDIEQLINILDNTLSELKNNTYSRNSNFNSISKLVYDCTLDGYSCERYYKEIIKTLDIPNTKTSNNAFHST